MLGNLVNVVVQYMREHVGNYMRDIRAPALKLLGLYGLQVRFFNSVSTPEGSHGYSLATQKAKNVYFTHSFRISPA